MIVFLGGAPQGGFSCCFAAIHLLYVRENTFRSASVAMSAFGAIRDPIRAVAQPLWERNDPQRFPFPSDDGNGNRRRRSDVARGRVAFPSVKERIRRSLTG